MSLEDLRKRIDEIDRKLVELLNERAGVVIDIGGIKSKTGKPIYAPDREKEVLEKITGVNKGPLPNKCLQAIWRESCAAVVVVSSLLALRFPKEFAASLFSPVKTVPSPDLSVAEPPPDPPDWRP